MTLIGVPIDSVGRSGGTEFAPGVLRELGMAGALGPEDAGDLDVSIRGEERDPGSGILAAPEALRTTATIRAAVAEQVAAGAACYNPEKDPDRACGRALVAALSAR
jgi:hypothetical protein